MFPIYRIQVFCEGSNSYGVSRQERWETVLQTNECKSIEEAREYVRVYSRQYTVLNQFLLQWRETKPCDREIQSEQEVINQFCFDNDLYLKYRRLFINEPPIELIRKSLRSDGIRVTKLDRSSCMDGLE